MIAGMGTLAVTAGAVMTGTAFAGDHSHMGHTTGPNKISQTALDCVNTGQACIQHCLENFQVPGFAECAMSVIELNAMCTALAQLANSKSKRLKQVAALSIEFCNACEKECRKHEKDHALCKACADACVKCATECKKIAA